MPDDPLEAEDPLEADPLLEPDCPEPPLDDAPDDPPEPELAPAPAPELAPDPELEPVLKRLLREKLISDKDAEAIRNADDKARGKAVIRPTQWLYWNVHIDGIEYTHDLIVER